MRHGSGPILGGLVCALLAAVASAQTVEFRIMERQGQGYMPWPPQGSVLYDNQLNFAVQSRVVGGSGFGLRSFAISIAAPCERDTWGTLDRLIVSNSDGTPVSNQNQGVNSEVGRGGLASQFCGIAEVSPGANGWLNASGDGYENNESAQDIGGIRGLAESGPLIRAVDQDEDGIPDTSPLNGMMGVVPEGATARLQLGVAETLFGADGNWVDVYRFRYTKTGFGSCPAQVEFRVVPVGMPTLFDTIERTGGAWRARSVEAAAVRAGSVAVTLCTSGSTCVADHDGSGEVNSNDLFQFINDWFSGCSGAGGFWCSTRTTDLDCNGLLTAEDLFAYLAHWFAGC